MDPAVAGAAIGFGGAFAVAITTQVIVGRRQSAELQARLDADRTLTDLAEARRVIDLAFERFSGLDARLLAVQQAALELESLFGPSERTAEHPQLMASTRQQLDTALYTFHEAARGALVTGDQLEIRFGRTAIRARYEQAVTELILAVSTNVHSKLRDSESRPDWRRYIEHVERSTAMRKRFAEEARRLVGLAPALDAPAPKAQDDARQGRAKEARTALSGLGRQRPLPMAATVTSAGDLAAALLFVLVVLLVALPE